MSFWKQFDFISPVTQIQKELIMLHDHAMMLLIGILVFVAVIGIFNLSSSFSSRSYTEGNLLEIVWTVTPMFLLLFLALPSLHLLYLMDSSPQKTSSFLKAVGHQWYWSYEISSKNGSEEFDSYMVNEGFRGLDVDNRVRLPLDTPTHVNSTSMDVLHAWTLPAAGVKMDSVPGRLNMTSLHLKAPGIYYGNCSEICGANHAFMPITVEVKYFESISCDKL